MPFWIKHYLLIFKYKETERDYDMQIEQSTLKTTASGICTVEDGIIYEVNTLYGNKTRVGVTDSKYNELKSLADDYYKKLVDLGVITPPKTPEQIQQETMQIMSSMMEQMKAMQAEMEVLRNERSNDGAAARNESAEHTETVEGMESGATCVTRRKQSGRCPKGN